MVVVVVALTVVVEVSVESSGVGLDVAVSSVVDEVVELPAVGSLVSDNDWLSSVLAVVVPVVVGFYDPSMLGGLLAGVTVSGVLFAIFQSNAGGAWDNAKKRIESDITVDGATHGKGSEAHKASVVGDTVGDPLKDTSGPSLNILIKLIAVVSLVIAPLIA